MSVKVSFVFTPVGADVVGAAVEGKAEGLWDEARAEGTEDGDRDGASDEARCVGDMVVAPILGRWDGEREGVREGKSVAVVASIVDPMVGAAEGT